VCLSFTVKPIPHALECAVVHERTIGQPSDTSNVNFPPIHDISGLCLLSTHCRHSANSSKPHSMRLPLASALLFSSACSSGHSDDQRRALDRVHQDRRCAEAVNLYGREPAGGAVSTESIAKDVAYAYLKSLYPNDRHLRPMTATLTDGVWTVNGTLPTGSVGGAGGIALCQSNGRVLEITHGK
jgi:hypothetical protein